MFLSPGHEPAHEHVREAEHDKLLPASNSKQAPVEIPAAKEVILQPEEHHDHSKSDVHSIIGVTLVAGFIFMLLVDQIGGSMHSHSAPTDTESPGHSQNRNKITATLGLVVHAAGLSVFTLQIFKTIFCFSFPNFNWTALGNIFTLKNILSIL